MSKDYDYVEISINDLSLCQNAVRMMIEHWCNQKANQDNIDWYREIADESIKSWTALHDRIESLLDITSEEEVE